MNREETMPEAENQTHFARSLRRGQTDAERALWARLRSRQLCGVKFRRQHPLGHYVVDFVSLEKRLIVELDGGQHGEDREERRDSDRTAWLESRGYRVLRFWNNEVLVNMDGVLQRIMQGIG